ncbi:hypothetical protein H8E88_26245 [candidate division KSB1 bacterium]|nr:hypothetical protein [candidate division KSB1 bacterium]
MKKSKQKLTILILGIVLFAGAMLPVTILAQNYEDSPFGFIQGEVVRGYRPSAEYLNPTSAILVN